MTESLSDSQEKRHAVIGWRERVICLGWVSNISDSNNSGAFSYRFMPLTMSRLNAMTNTG